MPLPSHIAWHQNFPTMFFCGLLKNFFKEAFCAHGIKDTDAILHRFHCIVYVLRGLLKLHRQWFCDLQAQRKRMNVTVASFKHTPHYALSDSVIKNSTYLQYCVKYFQGDEKSTIQCMKVSYCLATIVTRPFGDIL